RSFCCYRTTSIDLCSNSGTVELTLGCSITHHRHRFGIMSKFQHLLDSRHGPPAIDEVQDISRLLEAADAEYMRQVQQIKELTSANMIQLRKITEYRAMLSPIRKIPRDILEEIFKECLFGIPVMSPMVAPVLLGLVCQQWREISISTPSLWTSVYLVLPSKGLFPHSFNLIHRMFKLWLKRSGPALLLTIVIHIGAPTIPELASFSLESTDILNTILPFRHRWETLMFTPTCEEGFNWGLLDIPSQDFHMLTRVYIPYFRAVNRTAVRGILHGPRVEDVRCHRLPRYADPDAESRRRWQSELLLDILPGPRLTVLRIECQIPSVVLSSVLRHCPALQVCIARIIYERWTDGLGGSGSHGGVIHLGELVHLEIDDNSHRQFQTDSESVIPAFWQLLEMPKMETLVLSCRGSPHLPLPQQGFHHLNYLYPTILRLSISVALREGSSDIILYLRQNPQLQYLRIAEQQFLEYKPIIDNALVIYLTQPRRIATDEMAFSVSRELPRLSSLHLLNCVNIAMDLTLELIKSRAIGRCENPLVHCCIGLAESSTASEASETRFQTWGPIFASLGTTLADDMPKRRPDHPWQGLHHIYGSWRDRKCLTDHYYPED
ncbi:hypothetical protein C8J56DRAFT_242966, partial [Mycena floridula]